MFYRPTSDYEWIWPQRRGWKMRCCDCGLVHVMNFRIKNNHIEVQAIRDKRATSQSRRYYKKKLVEKI